MTTLDRRDLERLRHTPGEALLSRDFRDQAALEAQRRWWHVRAAHGAYGVVSGLLVRPVPPPPLAAVRVLPGLAYDAFGRELLLAAPRTAPVPSPPAPEGSLTLVLRYAQADGAAAADLAGVCPDLPRPLWEGELAWLASPTPLDGVPLARLHAEHGALEEGFRPPRARAFARPRIGSGATVAGGTAWENWAPGFPGNLTSLGVQVRVDTRAAGFTQVPCYFAWVQGNDPDGKPPVLSLPAAEFITAASTTGFLFRTRLALPEQTPAFALPDRSQVVRARRSLAVCWLGIQEPYPSLDSLSEVIHGHP